jgi:hypothetical protein
LRGFETNQTIVIGHQMISRVRRLAQQPPIPSHGERVPAADQLFGSHLPKPQRQRIGFGLCHT